MSRTNPLLQLLVCLIATFTMHASLAAAPAPSDTDDTFFIDEAPVPDQPSVTTPPPPVTKPSEATPAEANHPEVKPKDLKPIAQEVHTEDSHPIFDWSKHKGEKEVKHPFAEKGLVEVTKDRLYIYNVKRSDQKHAGSLHVGPFNPSNLQNPDTSTSAFADNYDQGNMMIFFDYEWQIWRIGVGKVGITAGGGIFFAQGSGHYVHPEIQQPGLKPPETFSLAVFPVSLGAIYRLQIWDKQLIVPYGSGGGTLFPFAEFRDDGKAPKFAGSAGLYFAVGGALNLTYFDRFSEIILDREYGINRVYLFGEFREMLNLAKYDFGGPLINFGFTAEF